MPTPAIGDNLRILPATVSDVPVILELIKALADFERLSHLVVANETLLRDALFGERPKAEVVLAWYQGKPMGFALYFHNFSTFLGRHGLYLEDLFVRPEARALGIGKALLMHVGAIAKERNCGRYEWAVLNWNEHALRFYRSLGAQPLDDWTIMRVTGQALQNITDK